MTIVFELGRPIDFDEKAVHRFWSKVDRSGPIPGRRPELGPCWPWTRSTSQGGYGRVQLPRRYGLGDPCQLAQAHRVSWQLAGNAIPAGLWVLHHCDNPPCVNPRHLFVGTRADNIADMRAKGRASGGSVPRPGESSPNAKITEAEVHAIREARAAGATCRALAAAYGVSPAQICRIGRGSRWAHLSPTVPAAQVESLGKVAWPDLAVRERAA